MAKTGDISVIVPGAGAGRRFGGRGNKIFQRIKGQPIFLRTLEAFATRDDVRQVQLVVSPADREEVCERWGGNLGLMGVALVEGGATRPDSVRNALAHVADEAKLICVHDAARPCVSPLWIDAVFAEARKTGAAILAYPVHGTLKKVFGSNGGNDGDQADISPGGDAGNDIIDRTVPRTDLWEAQTPQVFAREVLIEAYERDVEGVTDDSQLVEAIGGKVSVVMGDPRNIKITTPTDLALAAAVIDTLPRPKPNRGAHPFEEPKS